MICKKCGANIQDNSKFCGVCGEKIEEIILQQNIASEENLVAENTQLIEPVLTPVEPTTESVEQTAVPTPTVVESTVDQPIQPVLNIEPKKKNDTWIFMLFGVLLGVVALILVVFAFNNGSNSDVRVLEKALKNLALKAEYSGTIDAKLLIQSDTEDSMNLSATIKYDKQGDDNYNFNLTLNKSMFFDEMNIYASILDERATLYANSSLIDMLGFTSSTPSMWVYMTTTEQELEMQTGTEADELDDIDLRDILDEQHFKLIGKENNLNHYQLVINNDLINKIKIEASKEEDLKSFADSLGELTETYYVDFYINNSNELVKISMDLTNSLEDESIRSAVITFEFSNLDSTSVQIPTEVKNSAIGLETYMLTYAIVDESYDAIYGDTTLND